MKKKETVNIGRNGDFYWTKPKIISGKDAIEAGGCSVALGILFFLVGISIIIGVLH